MLELVGCTALPYHSRYRLQGTCQQATYQCLCVNVNLTELTLIAASHASPWKFTFVRIVSRVPVLRHLLVSQHSLNRPEQITWKHLEAFPGCRRARTRWLEALRTLTFRTSCTSELSVVSIGLRTRFCFSEDTYPHTLPTCCSSYIPFLPVCEWKNCRHYACHRSSCSGLLCGCLARPGRR